MNKCTPDPTERFTGRSAIYDLYRPRYPDALYRYLLDKGAIWRGCTVADVGSGTGIFASGLLDRGVEVFAVEPNKEMRGCAEEALGSNSGFHSIAGRSEATTLGSESIDAVTAAQAFHWFDTKPTRTEFSRILRPGGQVCIVYNERDVSDPFSRDYEALVGIYTDPDKERREASRDPRGFFEGKCKEASFPNHQELDLKGLQGRALSNSHMPKEGDDGYGDTLLRLSEIFHRYQENGRVIMRYNSLVYHGALE